MKRGLLAALLLVAIATLGGGTRAYAVPPPVSQFGVSDGDLIDNGGWTELANAAAVLTPDGAADNSFFRGAFHWAPTATAGPNWTTYDAAVSNATSDGLVVLPEIHTSIAGGGGYINPLTCTGPGCGTSNFEAAVASIAARYGPGGTYAQAHPGFAGITRYEVWNEPNTNTGTLNSNNADDTDPATFDAILHAESTALVSAATAGGWLGQLQIACCGFGNPGNGNHAYSLTYFKSLLAVPGNTVWSDISPSGALPGVITVHMYYQASDPSSCNYTSGETTGAEKCPQFLEASWAPYIHSTQSQPNVGMGITEGGYSGPVNCSSSSPSTVTEQEQSDWNTWTINYYRSVPDIGMQFLAYYEAMDDDTSGMTGHACWQPGLAPVLADGTFKPWGTAFQSLISSDANQPPPTPGLTDGFTGQCTSWCSANGGSWTVFEGPDTDEYEGGGYGVIDLSQTTRTDSELTEMTTPINSQDDSTTVTLPALPSANVTINLDNRIDAFDEIAGYRASFLIHSSGSVTVTLKTVNAYNQATTLATETSACTVTAGVPITLTFNAEGDSPTSLSASCGGGTPVTASDSTGPQTAGNDKVSVNPSATLTVPFIVDVSSYSAVSP